jgi:hypothetical protein
MSTYPSRYRLPALATHLISLMERRRSAFAEWDEHAEASLVAAAQGALDEAGQQFREVADDAPHWAKLEHTLLSVALPRYFRLAKEQHALESRGYDAWRGGDFVSRLAYGGAGLLAAIVAWRARLPLWFEPAPVGLFLFGPLIPDLQAWFANRKYARALAGLVKDMEKEQLEASTYIPFGIDEPQAAPAPVVPNKTENIR